jgi:hypothetical protein
MLCLYDTVLCVMCSGEYVFLRYSCFFCISSYSFGRSLWFLRFSWGLWFGVVVTLCSFLFPFLGSFCNKYYHVTIVYLDVLLV